MCDADKQHKRISKKVESYWKTLIESFIMSICIFSPLYLQYKQQNLCTSECFKARCVGEDRKSSHQLATDSVWEIFLSC